MIYKLFEQDVENLIELPETGMGYQIVEAAKYNTRFIKRYLVFNAELAIEYDSDLNINIRSVKNQGFSEILKAAPNLTLETNTIKVLSQRAIIGKFDDYGNTFFRNKKRHIGGTAAILNQKENANGIEIFVRVSAYEDDKRIDFKNRKLKPGSYTTTTDDYKDCVSTNDDPIDRYALPNNEPIKWSFYIQPAPSDKLQRGIVQPAFNHQGGGVEVYFEDGTANNTYISKRPYGK